MISTVPLVTMFPPPSEYAVSDTPSRQQYRPDSSTLGGIRFCVDKFVLPVAHCPASRPNDPHSPPVCAMTSGAAADGPHLMQELHNISKRRFGPSGKRETSKSRNGWLTVMPAGTAYGVPVAKKYLPHG